jgi:hypothetical protein
MTDTSPETPHYHSTTAAGKQSGTDDIGAQLLKGYSSAAETSRRDDWFEGRGRQTVLIALWY